MNILISVKNIIEIIEEVTSFKFENMYSNELVTGVLKLIAKEEDEITEMSNIDKAVLVFSSTISKEVSAKLFISINKTALRMSSGLFYEGTPIKFTNDDTPYVIGDEFEKALNNQQSKKEEEASDVPKFKDTQVREREQAIIKGLLAYKLDFGVSIVNRLEFNSVKEYLDSVYKEAIEDNPTKFAKRLALAFKSIELLNIILRPHDILMSIFSEVKSQIGIYNNFDKAVKKLGTEKVNNIINNIV